MNFSSPSIKENCYGKKKTLKYLFDLDNDWNKTFLEISLVPRSGKEHLGTSNVINNQTLPSDDHRNYTRAHPSILSRHIYIHMYIFKTIFDAIDRYRFYSRFFININEEKGNKNTEEHEEKSRGGSGEFKFVDPQSIC